MYLGPIKVYESFLLFIGSLLRLKRNNTLLLHWDTILMFLHSDYRRAENREAHRTLSTLNYNYISVPE